MSQIGDNRKKDRKSDTSHIRQSAIPLIQFQFQVRFWTQRNSTKSNLSARQLGQALFVAQVEL
jgi:hypothetical protein